MVYIETDRLHIRHFVKEDWQDLFAYTSNDNVMYYLPENTFSQEDAKRFVNKNLEETAKMFPIV